MGIEDLSEEERYNLEFHAYMELGFTCVLCGGSASEMKAFANHQDEDEPRVYVKCEAGHISLLEPEEDDWA